MLFINFFTINFKKIIKNPLFILTLIILPLCIFAILEVTKGDIENSFDVLVLFEKESEITDSIYEELLKIEYVNVVKAMSREEVEHKVVNETVQIGYIFDKNFDQNIYSNDLKEAIEMISLQDNPYSKIVNFLVFLTCYEQMIPYISSNELSSYDINLEIELIKQEIENYRVDKSIVGVIYVNEDGQLDVEDSQVIYLPLLQGMICIFLLILSLASSISTVKTSEDSLMLAIMDDFKLKLYKSVPMYVLSTCFAIISMYIIYANGFDIDFSFEIIKIICYQVALFLLNYIITKLLSKDIVILIMPIVVIATIITHPIILDISTYIPNLKTILEVFPTYQYLRFDLNTAIIHILILLFTSLIVNKCSRKIK